MLPLSTYHDSPSTCPGFSSVILASLCLMSWTSPVRSATCSAAVSLGKPVCRLILFVALTFVRGMTCPLLGLSRGRSLILSCLLENRYCSAAPHQALCIPSGSSLRSASSKSVTHSCQILLKKSSSFCLASCSSAPFSLS